MHQSDKVSEVFVQRLLIEVVLSNRSVHIFSEYLKILGLGLSDKPDEVDDLWESEGSYIILILSHGREDALHQLLLLFWLLTKGAHDIEERNDRHLAGLAHYNLRALVKEEVSFEDLVRQVV